MPALRPAARVVWIFARADESLARELLRFSAVLARQGLIDNWSLLDLQPGQDVKREMLERVRSADVLMMLVSADLLAESLWTELLATARAAGHARIVPVLLRSVLLPSELTSIQMLPRSGTPIMARKNRDDAFLEVIQGLQELVSFRPSEVEPAPPLTLPVEKPSLSVNDVFRLDGPPSITFVEPPQFPILKLELRTMGTGLIVEGPSKIGKSTAIKKAMESLGVPEKQQIWWMGQSPPPLDDFCRVLDGLLVTKQNTWLFIDDFHYLEDEGYRRALAFRMKALADQDKRYAKVTVIGINPLGSSLAQVMPDLAGRFRILRVDREKDWSRSTKIAELIIQGENALNVRYRRRDELIVAAGGSFFIAQLLCNRAAVQAGVLDTAPSLVQIDLGPSDVVAAIGDELAARYRAPMIDFASFDAAPPPRGAGLSLLWLLSRSSDGFVAIKEARLRFPALGATFDWFLESHLTRCFQEHKNLKGLLYFNRATATLTMEDPQLKFYLRELNWEELAAASGHGQVSFHPDDGPLWTAVTPPSIPASASMAVAAAAVRGQMSIAEPPRRLLHLSDLHFSSTDQATVAYAQLAADLRQQGFDSLEAVLVSGDLVNRAQPAEYDAARLFLEQLMSGFSVPARRVVLVPGNHDVSWSLSEAAYSLHKRARYTAPLAAGTFIEHGSDILEVRDEEGYRRRFQPFADMHRQVTGNDYPLDYAEQGVISDLSEIGVVVLGLNSAWEIDHHYKDRAGIHMGALSRALLQLGPPDGRLRVAMFHHPLQSEEESHIHDTSFIQQLAVNGFRVILHGHVHKADTTVYHYDKSAGGRQIGIVAAGTFGAPVREWVPGYPLQYDVLLVGKKEITVETRCRRELNGAWQGDAIWPQGPGKDPLPRYHLAL